MREAWAQGQRLSPLGHYAGLHASETCEALGVCTRASLHHFLLPCYYLERLPKKLDFKLWEWDGDAVFLSTRLAHTGLREADFFDVQSQWSSLSIAYWQIDARSISSARRNSSNPSSTRVYGDTAVVTGRATTQGEGDAKITSIATLEMDIDVYWGGLRQQR